MQGEEIGRRAVQWGLLTQAALDEVVAARPAEVGDYLAEKGYITGDDLRKLRTSSRPRLPAPEPEQRLGKYTLRREIGRGGMSVVWEARDNDLQRRVALKLLSAGSQNPLAAATEVDERELPRFIREAQTAAKLQHPSIVKVYEAGCVDGVYFISMEYIDGVTLADASTERRLEPGVIAAVVRDVARALQYAHEQGVLHRDVKPQNIMLTPAGHATIMDFGLAREIDSRDRLTVTGVVVGTPCYMSPEHVEGMREKVDPRSDVYSLGAVLYDAITGSPPFDGDNAMKVLLAVLKDDPVPPRVRQRSCPAELETICLKALSKEKSRRYASAAALADDLERFLQGDPILARRASVLYRLRKKAAKHRSGTAATAVAAAVLLAWGATSVLRARAHLRQAREHLARATDLERRGDFAHAVLSYDALLLQDPRSAEGRDGKRRCAEKEREQEEGRRLAEERRREELRREDERRGRLARGEEIAKAFASGKELARKGDFQGAVTQFTKAVEFQPDYAEAYHQRAHAWESLRQDGKATADLAKALEIDRGNPEYWVEMGTFKRRAKDYASAREHYEAAVAGWPHYAEAYHQLSHLYQETGDPARQEAALRKAVERDARSAEIRRELADLLGGRKEYKEAVTFYQNAIEIDPHLVEAYHQMGHAQMHLNDPEKAISAFSNAIVHGSRGKFYADRAEAHVMIWIAGGRRDAARLDHVLKDCTACIEKDPGLWRPWLWRARAHRARKSFEEARADYGKARERAPHLDAQIRAELEELEKEEKRGP